MAVPEFIYSFSCMCDRGRFLLSVKYIVSSWQVSFCEWFGWRVGFVVSASCLDRFFRDWAGFSSIVLGWGGLPLGRDSVNIC